MMHFTNAALDGVFFGELREAGILTPEIIDRIDALMGRPETGTLNDFLLAGADLVPEKTWLTWLIRRHGCHRFGQVSMHEEIRAWATEGPPADCNLPYRRCGNGTILVALLRPDCADAALKRWLQSSLVWAAATLRELSDLRAAWRRGR